MTTFIKPCSFLSLNTYFTAQCFSQVKNERILWLFLFLSSTEIWWSAKVLIQDWFKDHIYPNPWSLKVPGLGRAAVTNIISDTVKIKTNKQTPKLYIVLLLQNRELPYLPCVLKDAGDEFRSVIFRSYSPLLGIHLSLYYSPPLYRLLCYRKSHFQKKKKMAISQISLKWLRYCLVFWLSCQKCSYISTVSLFKKCRAARILLLTIFLVSQFFE